MFHFYIGLKNIQIQLCNEMKCLSPEKDKMNFKGNLNSKQLFLRNMNQYSINSTISIFEQITANTCIVLYCLSLF